jgi:hypothetical protein
MKQNNKLTVDHQDHEVITKRASPNSPHYGYYHCVTCNKFVTWITKETYWAEKRQQRKNSVMWFGKYQGTLITELPDDYLEWLIINVENKPDEMQAIYNEWLRRNVNVEETC